MRDPDAPFPKSKQELGDLRYAREATILTVIAGALAASVLIYSGVAWFVTVEAARAGYQPPGLSSPVSWALAAVAVALLLAAPIVERRIRSGAAGGGPEASLTAFRIGTVVGFAMREAAALLGLVIAITTGDGSWCYALSAVAIVAMAGAWPSRSRLERYVRGAVQPS